MGWRDATLRALLRYSTRHQTKLVQRRALVREELNRIASDVGSLGKTPNQTLSRVLQQLRDEGLLEYVDYRGTYFLSFKPVDIESEDLPDKAIDAALRNNKLRFGMIRVGESRTDRRQRQGQARLRQLTLDNYRHCCALCNESDTNLLVASHISRWGDDPEGRGDLTNVICLCKFHDALFETGYISFSDDLHVLTSDAARGEIVSAILRKTKSFRAPLSFSPSFDYLRKHRFRTGFDEE